MSLVQAYLVTLAQEELLRDAARERLARTAMHRGQEPPFDDIPSGDRSIDAAAVPSAPRRALASAAVGLSRLAGSTAHRLDSRVEVSISRRIGAGC